MSTNSKIAAVLASAGILAAGWSVGTANGGTVTAAAPATQTSSATTTAQSGTSTGTASSSTATTGTGTGTTTGATTAAPTSASPSATTTTGTYKDGTYTGTTATHRYGSVTVTVTISGGKITNATAALVDDGDRKSTQINNQSLPTIKARVIAANSASVSTVSGATYTTEAYLTSLQAALAKAV